MKQRYSITALELANFSILETKRLTDIHTALKNGFARSMGSNQLRIARVLSKVVDELVNRINMGQAA